MLRFLPSIAALLAACTPSPQKVVMPESNVFSNPAAGNAAKRAMTDSPAAVLGRRTLSTAFVRMGPNEHLTVELHDGSTLVLRDIVMRPADYCGVPVSGDAKPKRYCGGYADVAAARPSAAAPPEQPQAASGT